MAVAAIAAITWLLAACSSSTSIPVPTSTPVAASTPVPTPTTGPDLPAVLRQHFDAVNRDDVPVILSTFTDDATLVRGGCAPQAPCVGKAAIQLQIQRGLVQQARYMVLSITVSGDTASGRAELRNVNTINAGLERVVENFTAAFRGDKISRLIHELDVSDAQSAVFANFRACEYTTVNRAGQPLTWPAEPFYDAAEGRIIVTASIAFPVKAHNARRHPQARRGDAPYSRRRARDVDDQRNGAEHWPAAVSGTCPGVARPGSERRACGVG